MYSLTDSGRDAARQLLFDASAEDPTIQVLRLLEQRSASLSYLTKKVPDAPKALKSLLKKAFIELEETQATRDPLRSASARLRIEAARGPRPEGKLKKAERELLSYLELHPGSHNLAEVETVVGGASQAARALARRNIVTMEVEAPARFAVSLQTAAYVESSPGGGVSSDPQRSGICEVSNPSCCKASRAPARQRCICGPSRRHSHADATRSCWYLRSP